MILASIDSSRTYGRDVIGKMDEFNVGRCDVKPVLRNVKKRSQSKSSDDHTHRDTGNEIDADNQYHIIRSWE